MNASQKVTTRGVVIVLALVACAVVGAVFVEFGAIARGGGATISELTWTAWAAQPGAFVFVLAPLIFAAGFLAGHLFWQAAVVYEAIRLGVNLDAALRLACRVSKEYESALMESRERQPLILRQPMILKVSPEFVQELIGAGVARRAT